MDQKVEKLSTEAEKTQARVGSLVNTVDDVRSEVEKNREELQKTIGELTSVKGDLGVKSGLIATNAAELEALQELGQRNYHAFDITKSRHSQRVGSIDIRLKKASHKRNHYTMELLVDDKKVGLFRVFSGWPTGSRLLHPADPTSPAVTSEPKRRPRNPQIPYTPVRSWATRKGNKTLINRELSL